MNGVIKLKPCLKSYIWGGDYYKHFHKGDLDVISECWELSTRGDSSSIVDSGSDKGKRLDQVITEDDLGPNAKRFKYFPLLIKLIDAKENLSVQVHPSDEYALKHENSFGKSEMWHIINADEGCGIYMGFKKDYKKEEILERLNDGTILDTLNFFKVKPGETYIINPGTIHAIGKGVRLIEIQQNSDLTYRLYDYLRKDKDGNYRQLHIKQALEVINYHKYVADAPLQGVLADNQYFHVERLLVNDELVLKANEDSFLSFTFIEGEGMVDDIPYQIYDTFFLPNGKKCTIKGRGIVIVSRV